MITFRRFSLPRPTTQQGFTLIELLVTIVILGVLTAIALPSFLGQAAKAKQAAALKYIGVINRSQQMYFLEHDQFAPSSADLGFDPNNAPKGYTYTLTTDQGVMTSTQAIPTSPILRGYAGLAFITMDAGGKARIDTLICEGTLEAAPAPALVSIGSETQVTNCNIL